MIRSDDGDGDGDDDDVSAVIRPGSLTTVQLSPSLHQSATVTV